MTESRIQHFSHTDLPEGSCVQLHELLVLLDSFEVLSSSSRKPLLTIDVSLQIDSSIGRSVSSH